MTSAPHTLSEISTIEDLRAQVRATFTGEKARQFALDLTDLAYHIGRLDGVTELGDSLRKTLDGMVMTHD